MLATTATANSRVVHDVAEQLGGVRREHDGEVLTIRGPLARASLRLGVLRLPSPRARLGWLLTHLNDLPGSGIIYALTVSAAEDTARLLREAGHEVAAYTGRTDPAEREQAEAALKENRVKALVATSALGMGFDKPDLGFVVHLGAPSALRWPTTSRWAVPAAAPQRGRTAAAGHRGPGHLGVLRHRIDAQRGRPPRCCASSPRPARRCPRRRWRRW